jgi:hypothetical protein
MLASDQEKRASTEAAVSYNKLARALIDPALDQSATSTPEDWCPFFQTVYFCKSGVS